MKSVVKTCLGALAAIVAVGGLAFAASASGADLYYIGLAVFALGVAGVFAFIKLSFDAYERDPERPRREVKAPAKSAPAPAAMPAPQAAPRLPASQPASAPFLSPSVQVWVRGGIVAVIGVLGLVIASAAHGGGWGYYGGIFVFVLCLLAVFRLIALQYDDAENPAPLLPVPEDPAARLVRGGLAVIVFLVALVVAAGGHGTGTAYHGGLIAAGCAVAYIFYLIQMSFGAEAQDH